MHLLILCGGKAKRLRPLTENLPKALVPVGGKPLVDYQIASFRRWGITDIILCSGYRHEVLRERYPALAHSVETEELGTGGAVKNAERFIHGDFVVTNGDNLWIFNFPEMHRVFEKVGSTVMSLTRLISPYGLVETDDRGRVIAFREKPALDLWLNAGITIFPYATLEYFPKKGMLEEIIYPRLAREGRLYGYKFGKDSFWIGIDTLKDLETAKRIFPEKWARHWIETESSER